MKHKDVLFGVKNGFKVIDGGDGGLSSDLPEKRRTPRWKLDKVLFRSLPHGRIFSVVDLSLKGMSLASDVDDQSGWLPGMQIQGVLSFFSQKLPIQGRVRYKRESRVGCEFESLLSSVQLQLERFLDPEILGGLLKWIPFHDPDADWFVGPCGTSVLIRGGHSLEPTHVSVYVLGIYVQWEKQEGTTTGTLNCSDDRDESRGVFHLQTQILQKDVEIDSLKLSIAKKVILSSNISEEFKSWCRHFIF